jgi:TRAP-type transport system periplasmic protein
MIRLGVKILVIAGLSLVLFAGARASVLKIATLAPAGTSWMQQMTAGADAIEQRTAGRVKLKFYPGGVMGNHQSVHRKIRIGQLQGGAFTPGGMSSIESSIQVLGLPMLFRNFDEVDFVRERLDPILKQKMADSGFVILGITEGGFARILSKQPMQDLESLRAGKVWVPEGDQLGQTIFRALGITPIALPIGDVFTGLQTGLIDTVAVNPTSAIAFQWHSSTGYMTEVPITYLIGLLTVQKKAFDRLAAEDREIVIEEMGKVFARMDISNRADDAGAIEALKSHGITFVPANPGEAERWAKIADGAIDAMVSKGLIEADVVSQVRGHLQALRARQ